MCSGWHFVPVEIDFDSQMSRLHALFSGRQQMNLLYAFGKVIRAQALSLTPPLCRHATQHVSFYIIRSGTFLLRDFPTTITLQWNVESLHQRISTLPLQWSVESSHQGSPQFRFGKARQGSTSLSKRANHAFPPTQSRISTESRGRHI